MLLNLVCGCKPLREDNRVNFEQNGRKWLSYAYHVLVFEEIKPKYR